jgi:hypothetical protein
MANPNGIPSQSPGLAQRAYPGFEGLTHRAYPETRGPVNPSQIGFDRHPATRVAEAPAVALGEGVDADDFPTIGGLTQGRPAGIAGADDRLDVIAETAGGGEIATAVPLKLPLPPAISSAPKKGKSPVPSSRPPGVSAGRSVSPPARMVAVTAAKACEVSRQSKKPTGENHLPANQGTH